jgi:hypothetical protein
MSMQTFESTVGTSVMVLDSSTGEVLSEKLQFTKRQEKFAMPGGYAIVSLLFFSKLAELKISADAYRLCARIMASANYGGLVNKSNDEYAAEIGVDKSRISRLIWKLHDAGVIHRIGPRSIFINPAYLFRGTARDQNEAVKRWSELRHPKIVNVKERRKTA